MGIMTIDGRKVEFTDERNVLTVIRKAGIDIPTLCFMKDVNPVGACRICVVEIKGVKNLMASCVYPVFEGMEDDSPGAIFSDSGVPNIFCTSACNNQPAGVY